jgi:TolB protein
MLKKILLSLLPFLFLSLAASTGQAQLKIDINKGKVEPLPIAITDPTGGNRVASDLGRDIMRVVSADLERSGLFRPINKNSFIQVITSGDALPRFPDWRQINAQALVTSTITQRGGDNFSVAFRLWDVYGEQQIAGKEFNTFRNNWRRIAHLLADEIYKRMTGENGYFDSRIVYVAESGPANRRVKKLAIMDQDGENHKYLSNGSFLVLTPRFSPDSQDILYMSYAARIPRVYLRDLQTGREESLGQFEGMSFSPRFANDGGRMLMSIARGGITNIYEMDLRSRRMRMLTGGGSINTSPSYSPDGRQIVFESDRGGSQQLYIIPAGGGSPRRISYGDGRYASPVWSPRGDWIAFTKMKGGQFSIGLMRADGSGERLLDQSFLVEGPTWSPNGRVLMYTRQDYRGGNYIYSIDITGNNKRKVMTPMEASDPAWSPLLPL